MDEFNFTKIKRSHNGNGTRLSQCLKISRSFITIAGDLFGPGREYVKFDVDTGKKAIRIAKGQEGGTRSYSMSPTSSGTSGALGGGVPVPLRKLVTSGELPIGKYVVTDQNKDKGWYILVHEDHLRD